MPKYKLKLVRNYSPNFGQRKRKVNDIKFWKWIRITEVTTNEEKWLKNARRWWKIIENYWEWIQKSKNN